MKKPVKVQFANAQPDYDQKPVARLVISWAVAGVPLLWAVYQTFLKSLALSR